MRNTIKVLIKLVLMLFLPMLHVLFIRDLARMSYVYSPLTKMVSPTTGGNKLPLSTATVYNVFELTAGRFYKQTKIFEGYPRWYEQTYVEQKVQDTSESKQQPKVKKSDVKVDVSVAYEVTGTIEVVPIGRSNKEHQREKQKIETSLLANIFEGLPTSHKKFDFSHLSLKRSKVYIVPSLPLDRNFFIKDFPILEGDLNFHLLLKTSGYSRDSLFNFKTRFIPGLLEWVNEFPASRMEVGVKYSDFSKTEQFAVKFWVDEGEHQATYPTVTSLSSSGGKICSRPGLMKDSKDFELSPDYFGFENVQNSKIVLHLDKSFHPCLKSLINGLEYLRSSAASFRESETGYYSNWMIGAVELIVLVLSCSCMLLFYLMDNEISSEKLSCVFLQAICGFYLLTVLLFLPVRGGEKFLLPSSVRIYHVIRTMFVLVYTFFEIHRSDILHDLIAGEEEDCYEEERKMEILFPDESLGESKLSDVSKLSDDGSYDGSLSSEFNITPSPMPVDKDKLYRAEDLDVPNTYTGSIGVPTIKTSAQRIFKRNGYPTTDGQSSPKSFGPEVTLFPNPAVRTEQNVVEDVNLVEIETDEEKMDESEDPEAERKKRKRDFKESEEMEKGMRESKKRKTE